MFTIQLDRVRFHAYHGLYEEERKLGNEFELTLHAYYQLGDLPVTSMEETVDYTQIYELVKKRMDVPTPLLETVVSHICLDVLERFELIHSVSCTLSKLHPPVEQMRGSLGVNLTLHRNDLE